MAVLLIEAYFAIRSLPHWLTRDLPCLFSWSLSPQYDLNAQQYRRIILLNSFQDVEASLPDPFNPRNLSKLFNGPCSYI